MFSKIFKSEYIYSVATKIIMVFIAFFHSIVLARFLGAELKGIHAAVYSIMTLGAVIVNISLQQAYPFFRRKYGKEYYFDRYMTFVTIYHAIIIGIGLILACFLIRESVIGAMAAILIPVDGFTIVIAYVCLIEHPKYRNTIMVLVDLIDTAFVTFLFLFVKADLIYIFAIFMLPFILKTVLYIRKIRFHPTLSGINLKFVREILIFSFFPMISMLLTMLNYRIDVLMLSMDKSVMLAQIGVYSIGISLADKVVYIPDAVKEILLSKLTKGKGEDEVAKTMRLCFMVSLSVALLLIIVGEPVIDFLYGSDFKGAYAVTLICVFGTASMVFFKMVSQYNNVHGKQRLTTFMLSTSIVANIILNFILIPRYNIIGAAVATFLSHIMCAVIFIVYFRIISGISIRNMIFPNKSDFRMIMSYLKPKKEA